jgi:hypothetical protein
MYIAAIASSHPVLVPHPTNGSSMLPPHFQATRAGYLPALLLLPGQDPAPGYMTPTAGYSMPPVVPHGQQLPSAPSAPTVTGVPVDQHGSSDNTRHRNSHQRQQEHASRWPKKEGLEEPLLQQ